MGNLSVPEKHQLKIARDTIKMDDAMAKVMGGMTREEAKRFLFQKGFYSFPPPPVSTIRWDTEAWIRFIDKEGKWL